MSDVVWLNPLRRCKACLSTNQRKFRAEMIIHPVEAINTDKSAMWAGQELFVCFNCGTSEFVVPEAKIRLLQKAAIPPVSRTLPR